MIDYYNRAAEDWDYAIICNTFLNPYQLQNELWPPINTVHQIVVEDQPIAAVLKRGDKSDLEGVQYLKKGEYELAIQKLTEAMSADSKNESILINLARAYMASGQLDNATQILDSLFTIYPDNEWGIDILGNIAIQQKEYLVATELFEKNLKNNYKFFHSYVSLAKARRLNGQDDQAVEILKGCLRINPFYEPAYQLYGSILIDRGETELGRKMLEYRITGNSKYGRK